MITLKPIGIIHTPFKELKNMPIQPVGADGIQGTIEIFDEYTDGLADLDGFSHIIVLFHFHKHQSYSLKVKPFLDDTPRGLFATRAPRRPNPIGLSVVGLKSIKGNMIHIENPDMLDGTPILDIKPYVPQFEPSQQFKTGWLEKVAAKAKAKKSDTRFLK